MTAMTSTSFARSLALGGGLFALVLTSTSCAPAPKHRYSIPDGEGRIVYDAERGIHREGSPVDVSEEELFRRGIVEFDDRDYEAAAKTFHQLRTHPAYVDGARALDAVVMEAVSVLEAGRPADSQWLVGDLAGAWFDPTDVYWRGRLPERLWGVSSESDVRPFLSIVDEDAIRESFEITKDIFDYYPKGLGVARGRLLEVSRHARNLAWVASVTGEDDLAGLIAADLVKRQPRGVIEAQGLLLLAQSEVRRELFEEARVHFARIYEIADDASLRERALLGEVEAIIRQSKGPEFDRTLYDLANEKINEYKTDFLVQHTRPRLVSEFATLEAYVNEVIWNGLKQAAEDYRRLFEHNAAALADRRAEEFRKGAIKRERMLRQKAGLPVTEEN